MNNTLETFKKLPSFEDWGDRIEATCVGDFRPTLIQNMNNYQVFWYSPKDEVFLDEINSSFPIFTNQDLEKVIKEAYNWSKENNFI